MTSSAAAERDVQRYASLATTMTKSAFVSFACFVAFDATTAANRHYPKAIVAITVTAINRVVVALAAAKIASRVEMMMRNRF